MRNPLLAKFGAVFCVGFAEKLAVICLKPLGTVRPLIWLMSGPNALKPHELVHIGLPVRTTKIKKSRGVHG